jgi:predicted RNA binding protein YcfA (HicA-like mRNA interferase family)
MAKIPRNIDSDELIKLLIKHFDYQVTRQTGSHIRLSTDFNGSEHKITIPNHSPIKIGTLNAILNDIAEYLNKSKSDLTQIFWN